MLVTSKQFAELLNLPNRTVSAELKLKANEPLVIKCRVLSQDGGTLESFSYNLHSNEKEYYIVRCDL